MTASTVASTLGMPVTFTARITEAAATGSVQFAVDGTPVGSAVTLAGGIASMMTSALTLGAHTITAAYGGDAGHSGSTGAVNVSVSDLPPVFAVPPDITAAAASTAGAVVPYPTPVATDLADGTVPVSCLPGGGALFAVGTTVASCTAVNSSGMRTTHTFTITVQITNQPPSCTGAVPSVTALWPPDHRWVPIAITGVTDADRDPVSITITSIFQDEPVNGLGDGDTAPDGAGLGSAIAQVRAERAGTLNGRVYHIGFLASDGRGGTCSGQASVAVPHDQSPRGSAVDDGAVYNSVTGAKKGGA